jgi:hypothetical protein
VGLSRTRFGITHWVTITNFMGSLPLPRSRIYLGTSSVRLVFPLSARHLPRAPLRTKGVTSCAVASCTTSEGIAPPS